MHRGNGLWLWDRGNARLRSANASIVLSKMQLKRLERQSGYRSDFDGSSLTFILRPYFGDAGRKMHQCNGCARAFVYFLTLRLLRLARRSLIHVLIPCRFVSRLPPRWCSSLWRTRTRLEASQNRGSVHVLIPFYSNRPHFCQISF